MTYQERSKGGRDEFAAGSAGVERELRRLVPAPVPPGLRSRMLARSAEARRGAALVPWMRIAALACAALIGVLLALDPLLVRHEAALIAVVLDGRSVAAAGPESAPELAEVGLGQGPEAARWARLQDPAAAARRPGEGGSLKAWERLKERWDYETSEDPD